MNELALFSGAGGGILGGSLLGWRTVAAVEVEDYPRRVLLQRQADGLLPRFPIWDDIRTFDGTPWRGRVGVISGGFPCQDISAAGSGKGISGERSGLWSEMARIISEVRPRYAFVENSPMLVTRGLERVIGDLTEMGYDCRWGIISASDIGAKHKRKRIWIVAYTDSYGWTSTKESRSLGTAISEKQEGQNNSFNLERASCLSPAKRNVAYPQRMGRETGPEERGESTNQESSDQSDNGNQDERTGDFSNTQRERLEGQSNSGEPEVSWAWSNSAFGHKQWWVTEPQLGRVANGVAHRVDRLKAIGNGQVPLCAATAWRILTKDWK